MARTAKINVNGEEIELKVPSAPALLPNKLKAEWEGKYIEAFQEAAEDQSIAADERNQKATREANRVLKVTAPKTYEEAKALPGWQVHDLLEGEVAEKQGREIVKRNKLRLVTIDGKKFSFDVPKAAAKAASEVKPPAA